MMINEKTVEYIKQLSLGDKKTLSQKALKVCEETGELARIVLPIDNADCTAHRFVTTEQALEEVVDVMLSAVSIAYELGCTDEELDAMFVRKCAKWSGLQNRDKVVNLPYEIHVTVSVNTDSNTLDMFRDDCKSIGVKPIILDLDHGQKTVMQDVQTSSVYFGDNYGAYRQMMQIVEDLRACHYKIIRQKIETVPWHPSAPSVKNNNTVMPKDCYFEAHIPCIVDDEHYVTLVNFCTDYTHHNLHLSKNPFKKFEDGSRVIMITKRLYGGTRETFDAQLQAVVSGLQNRIKIGKVITEFSIYDTNISHDNKWLINPD